jgi:excisionase family DNA binding protein
MTLDEYLESLPPGDPRRTVNAYVEMKNKGPQTLEELRQRVIEKRQWAAQAARVDNAAGGGLHDWYDYESLAEDVQAIGLMALGLGRADVYAICSVGESLGHTEAAVLLDRVAKMLEAPAVAADKPFLSVKEAAKLKGVSAKTVYRAIGQGLLPAENLSTGKGRPTFRIARSDLCGWAPQAGEPAQRPVPTPRPRVKSRHH